MKKSARSLYIWYIFINKKKSKAPVYSCIVKANPSLNVRKLPSATVVKNQVASFKRGRNEFKDAGVIMKSIYN